MAETVVEVVHYRDPDASCEMRVFVDGAEVSFNEVTIDTGAGYSLADWDEHRERALDGLSTKAHDLATRWFDSAEDKSEYIGG
ncbi:MAG: hypothetical protein ACYCZN_01845 [Candidatus Dormibacteria bacterium]